MKELSNIYFANLNAVWNSGGYFIANAQTKWGEDWHQFSQNKFYFITKGHCMIQVEDQKFVANPGDWFFIPAHVSQTYYNIGEPFEKYWMHFDLYPGDNLLHELQIPYMINVSGEEKIYKLFERFGQLNTSKDLTDQLQIKAILLTLLAEYIRMASPSTISLMGIGESLINDVLRYIGNNLEKPLSNAELAQRFHMHPNHFIRFFKEKTGQTPARYVRICKLETAKRLIEESDMKLNEIMESIGFYDLGNFSRQFKSFYALSPREYKKSYIESKSVPD